MIPPMGAGRSKRSLDELGALAETAGATVVGRAFQRRSRPDPVWYFGKGRAAELLDEKAATDFNVLIVDDELAPEPAAQPRDAARLQGPRPIRADHRHLRPSREDPGGPPPGGARRPRIPPAAADPDVDPPVAHRRRDRHPWPRREPARDGPSAHPREDQEGQGRPGRRAPPSGDCGTPARTQRGRQRRPGRLHQCRQEHASQRAGRCGPVRGRHALRDARSDQSTGHAAQRPRRRGHRYGRLHQQAAARPGRCLPCHARGG